MSRFQVEVAISQLEQPLSYHVPDHLRCLVKPLTRVMVPLQKRQVMGFALNAPYPTADAGLKTISDVLDDVACLPPTMLRFFERAAAYYQVSLGRFLEQALPAGLGKINSQTNWRPNTLPIVAIKECLSSADIKPQEQLLLDLIESRSPVLLKDLREVFPRAAYWLPRLERKGLITVTRQPVAHDLLGRVIAPGGRPAALSAEQRQAVNTINGLIENEHFKACLLHGVTGSGKTEVYLAAVEKALERGQSALMLVPEIGLCLRLHGIMQNRFAASGVAILHSGLTPTQRRQQWALLASGQARIGLGARSAVFAPLADLGVICVDEEQDEAYKQEDRLRYNARDLALLRGQEQSCPVVLGSATPAVSSYYHSQNGDYLSLRLSKRVHNLPLPRMEIVDLRATPKLLGGFLSPRLYQALKEVKQAGRQSILFLNRRGFAPAMICGKCGEKISCPACSLSLTWHQQRGRLVCHLCGIERMLPTRCGACSAPAENFKPLGLGTEAVEEKFRELDPSFRLARLDRDSAGNAGQLAAILNQVLRGEVDVLIGTQMLSKGHHFPNLTLVGVLMADQGLYQPDFRVAERAYTLLTQVAGRAGRQHEQGLVLVQTYNPGHHALQAAINNDETGFYQQELEERQALNFPPFGRLISLRLDATEESLARKSSARLAEELRKAADKLNIKSQILGPAPAPIAKVQNRWRYYLLIKAGSASRAASVLRLALFRMGEMPRQVKFSIDVDPLQFG